MDKLSHRKSSARVSLKRPDGSPLSREKVRFKLKKHEFLFGGGANDAIAASRGDAGAAERVDTVLALNNYTTLHFYWGRFEPNEGEPRTADLMSAAKYLRGRGVTLKGHPLVWHTVCADWLMKYDNDTIFEKLLGRIRREVGDFKGVIDMWDVINEVAIMPVFKYDNAITRVCREHGRVRFVKEVFAAAREANPDAVLLLNDYNTGKSYDILTDGVLSAGADIDVIGIQSHQHQGYRGAEFWAKMIETFKRYGKPLHFTENTLVSGALMPPHYSDLNDFKPEGGWPSTPEGEERQTREAVELYTLLFEEPAVEAITTWDSHDGGWLGAPAGLIRADNTVKPAYEELMRLIHGAWSTDAELVTDEDGAVELTGFRGTYEANGKTFVLEKNTKEVVL